MKPAWLVIGHFSGGGRVVLWQAPDRDEADRQAALFRPHLDGYRAISVEPRNDPAKPGAPRSPRLALVRGPCRACGRRHLGRPRSLCRRCRGA